MIEVEGLVKRYGSIRAVDGISFTIEKGKIYGFLGPNGAGKSTTMNILTGYISATEGIVRISGFNMEREPEKAKACIGYLPEVPPLYPDMTVREYLEFAASLKKINIKKKDEQIKKIMRMTKIMDVEKHLIRTLSKGYKQRVGLAQAILGFPEVIILDEPMVGLDPKQIMETRDVIKSFSKNHTILLSSHILSEINAICDEIIILSKGRVVAQDTPENLANIMANNRKLEVLIKGRREKIELVLGEIEAIISFERIAKDEEPGTCCYEITERENVDIREELFYLLAREQLPIHRLQIKTISLEEVFLELTSVQEPSTEEPVSSKGTGSGEVSDESHL